MADDIKRYTAAAIPRHCRIHLSFWPRSPALISQLSLVPGFGTTPLRYIVPRLFSSAITAFWRDPNRILSNNIPCSPTLPEALQGPHPLNFFTDSQSWVPRHVDCMDRTARRHVLEAFQKQSLQLAQAHITNSCSTVIDSSHTPRTGINV